MSGAVTTYNRGLIARRLGKLPDAQRLFVEVLRLDPQHIDAAYHLVLALADQQDEDEQQRAVRLAQRLVEDRSESAAARTALGWAYYRSGDFDKARDALAAARRLPNPPVEAPYFLARTFERLGAAEQTAELEAAVHNTVARAGLCVLRPQMKRWLAARSSPAP